MEPGVTRDAEEDALRDAAHDAFMAFWRAVDTTQANHLWLYHCAAQERYERRMRELVAK
jgi:hypothetical protein